MSMNMVEAGIRNGKGTKQGSGVSVNFGFLTLSASTGPGTDISVDARPNVPLRDEMLVSANSWMGQRMEFVKNQTSMTKWDIRSCTAGRDVTQDSTRREW